MRKKHELSFVPKDGEFVSRAKFWGKLLRPVMSNRNYRKAMVRIISWYIHIKHIHQNDGLKNSSCGGGEV